jgi:hypothetical protein
VRLIAGILLIVGALSALGFARREGRIHQQKTLAAVASELAARPVGVRCPGFFTSLVRVGSEAGSVKFDGDGRPANYTELAPETCSALRHIDRVDFSCLDNDTCTYKEFKVAWAAHTLAHEAFHLRGFEAEAIAECYALQTTAFVAERLGVDAATAQRLQRWVYTDGYPNEPEDYRSDECRDGGRLDLRPQTAAFP